MPSFAAALRAISDCVQNQTTNAPAITPARRPTPVQDRLARIVIMGFSARAGRAPAGFAFYQHPFELPPEFICNGITVGAAIARRVCFDGFTDGDDGVQWRMRAGGVGQVLLVTLDGFEQTLGSWRIGEVVARVTVQLLGEIQVRELPPATRALLLGEFAMDHVGQDRRAQTLDPRHRIRFAVSAVPLPFEWFQEVIEQTRKPLHDA